MPTKSNPDLSLFIDILIKLEQFDIPYVVIGGFAATLYGITRTTYDIDIVVDLNESHIDQFAQAYPLPRYYADPHQMKNSMTIGTSFNIIDTNLGEKADLFPITMDDRYLPALQNRVRKTVEVVPGSFKQFWMARPEEVIYGKLLAWNESQSHRHSADIFEMMVYYHLGGLGSSYQFDTNSLTERLEELDSDTRALWELINNSAIEEASKIRNE